MKKHLSKKRVVLAAVVVVALAIASGVAYAYFSSGGNSTGTAGVGTSSSLTVSQTGSVSGLVPGGAAQNVVVHVVNPATFKQSLNAVGISIASIAPASCLTTWFTVTPPTVASPVVLGAGASQDFTGTIAMIEPATPTNQDVCKNAAINLSLVAS